ncbi:cytosine permease [Amycolatopsis sp. NBC_01480]|uniref:cytosine permease n=1 Tax=Amycolatopsis sp. NBC_01480 TaxID=2903562 RepID=UPI002E29F809|nr:cytosine permease [Amycolatopsis sp. NBC_01480]
MVRTGQEPPEGGDPERSAHGRRSRHRSRSGGGQEHSGSGSTSGNQEHSHPRHQLEGSSRGRLKVETHGINVIGDADRRGWPRQLFWPWFGANVSILGLSYGSFALGFGISFWQAVVAGVIGIVFSFLLCGFIAVAGKRGSAPTMTLSRAAFGVCR